MNKDRAAAPAIVSPWSNGQTKGQITKLKLVKRQMYGGENRPTSGASHGLSIEAITIKIASEPFLQAE